MAQQTWAGTDIAKDVIQKIDDNFDEIYPYLTEITNARDGESTLKDQIDDIQANVATVTTEVTNARDGETNLKNQIDALQDSIASLAQSNGSLVSDDDTTPGYLSTKLLSGQDDIVFTVTDDGADETLVATYTGNTSSYNMLSNTRFQVNSRSVLTNLGFGNIGVSGIVAGVCTVASGTFSVTGGSLVTFTGGASTDGNTYIVTATTGSTTFTINDTTITQAGAVTCVHYAPVYSGADAYAPDFWHKSTTATISVLSTPLISGGINMCKILSGAAEDYVGYNIATWVSQLPQWLEKFYGRTVTFGAWVLASVADKVRLKLIDGTGTTSGDYHTGGGTWEWLTVTRTISTSATNMTPRLYIEQLGELAYFKSPILIYGSYIPSGAYSPKPSDKFQLNAPLSLATIAQTEQSDVATTNLYLPLETSGKLGMGLTSLIIRSNCNDSGCQTVDCGLYIGSAINAASIQHINSPYGHLSDCNVKVVSEVFTNETGKIGYTIDATGSGTFDVNLCTVQGVTI